MEEDIISEKIKRKISFEEDYDLSSRINQYIKEKNSPPIDDLEIATKNKFKEFEKRYAKISNDLEKMDQEFEKCGNYTNKRIKQIYDHANMVYDSGVLKKGLRIKGGIIGREVVDVNARVIGKVKDVDVNIKSRTLEALIIGKGGILGNMGSTASEIVIPYHMVLSIGDKILVKS